MRFRAKMTNHQHVTTLSSIVTAFQKAAGAKVCCLRITPTKLHFTMESEALEDDSRIWIEVIQTHLFESFVVQSLHEGNEILLQVNLDHFSRALRSAAQSHDLVMKLTKKDDHPFLTFKIGTVSSTGMTRSIVQDVPVTVRPADDIQDIIPPALPTPEVNIYLPDIKLLRNIVDRMKAIGQSITLRANMEGELELQAESDIVTVKTCFNHLDNPAWRESHAPDRRRPARAFSAAKISARKLAQFIAGAAQGVADNLLLSIGANTVMLFLLHNDMTLTFMLPILT